ncbi:translocation/assembly module TamB domain-containing protein [Ekhidna sp.]
MLLLLQLQPIQTFLAQKVLQSISSKTDHEITINKIKISWLDRASLEDVFIRDLQNDTLLYAQNLMVNYEVWDLINGEYLNIEEVESKELRLKLTKYDSASKINLSQFIDALKTDAKKDKSKFLNIEEVSLSNLQLSLEDRSKKHNVNKLDFSNLNFIIPDFTMSMLSVKTDTIIGSIMQMRGYELNSNFIVKDFSTVFRVSNQSLSVNDLDFVTPTSHITDSLEFFYSGLDDFGSFVDSVSFILHFKDSRISKEDMRIILGIDAVKENLTIDGVVWGTIGDFNIEETRFGYGSSYFVGGVSCFGLPDISQTFILADLTDSHVIPDDLKPYIGDYSENLQQMGKIDFTGSFAGFLNDFVARGDFLTNQGSVHTDINIKIPENPSEMSYEGNLEFKDVNVGAFFQNDLVQRVNLKAAINGKGIKPENADFELKALVYQSGLKGYVYDSIEADGKFAKNYFEGSFSVQDANCLVDGIARVDLRQDKEVVKIDTKIEIFNADSLNLTAKSITGKGKINLEIEDLDIDNFKAKLKVDSGLFSLEGKELILDSIRFAAGFDDSVRVVELAFPGFESSLKGAFKVSNVLKDIPNMASGYASLLQLKEDSVEYVGSGESYKLSFNAIVTNVSPYLDSLDLPVSIGGQTVIDASFRQSKNVNVSLFLKSDTLIIGKNEFHDPIIELNGSKDLDASSVLTNFLFESERQVIPGVPDTEGLLLEGVWFDDNIEMTTIVSQPVTASSVRVESSLKLYEDSLVLKMLPSDIQLLDDNWNFNPTNKIVITEKGTSISNLEIYDSSESITIEGNYAESDPTSILISAEDLNMDKVGLFSDAEISGFLNGNFKLFRKTADESFQFDGAFLLKNLRYDDLIVGDVSGSSQWNPVNKSIFTKVEVERKDVNAIQVKGFYYPKKESEQLDFSITFDEAELKMGEPFLSKNFSDIEGVANGSLKLTGSLASPRVIGNCRIEGGGVTINYLNTHYKFNGQLDFDPKVISLVNFDLIDRKGSNANVSGGMGHSSFKDFIADFKVNANKFEFLNTTALDNSLYYGSTYGTGRINVTGPLNDLNISAKIRTEADTRFYIPISEGSNVGQEEYITFIDFTDTTQNAATEDFTISGLTLDFDIEVTPDAYCELIFNQRTGEIIQGRGTGNLKLRLDSDGEFDMFGTLTIDEGSYNFTPSLGGTSLISKLFDVTPGSTITWFGEPYNASLDFEAVYLQRASFEDLKNPENQLEENLNEKVPLLVVLDLTGPILSPDIKFEIRLKDPVDAIDANNAILKQLELDKEELERQVISLLFLRRFTPRESFFTSNEGFSVSKSVSEVLSNQLSYLANQVDENLELEIDLADLSNEAFNSFQLRFAYTLLNGRLKVARGGDFGNPEDNNDNVLNDIVGDWSVEYSLTKDGRLRAKVFRNTNQRIQITDNQQNQETGISLRFVHSFNDLSDLLTRNREEAILRRKEETEEEAKKKEEEEDKDASEL